MKRTAGVILGLAAVILWGGQPLSAFACGDVITQYDYGDGLIDERTPIDDCNNPFNADTPDPYSYNITINGIELIKDAIVTISEGGDFSGTYQINKPGNSYFNPCTLYRADGNDYREVGVRRGGTFNFSSLPEGEYVAVLVFEEIPIQIFQTEPTWKQWLKSFFLPATAYAYYQDYQEVVAIPFIITYTTPEPLGASSVLFLPGIMGSRLYEESDVCGGGPGIKERWFSPSDCAQLRLTTSFTGRSDNDIYTTNEPSGIVDATFGLSLYKSFLEDFESLESDGVIADFEAVPYDWRLKLDDILKSTEADGKVRGGLAASYVDGYLYQTIARMAEDSLSGKVTIVTHSNGGLVAKAFLSTLEANNDPLLPKIDNLILVGVPQSGTPESVISLLHGSEIGPFGAVLNQVTSRTLINTMPFIHHLLPSEAYFTDAIDPVIIFESGVATDEWRTRFGESITDKDTLHSFLSKSSGRADPDVSDSATPEVTDPLLLEYANIAHQIQSAWTPPASLGVSQIAGVGVQTPATISYFTDQKCVSRILFLCTQYEPKLGTRITTSPEGDGTVMGSSAQAIEDIETLWLDLDKYNNDVLLNRVHKDMLEVSDVQAYIANTLGINSEFEFEYISENPVNLESTDRVVYQLHSPLDMKLRSPAGELSSTTRTIEGGYYQRFGEVQYISVPSDISDTELLLFGQEFGSFTLEVEEWEGEELVERIDFVGIPSDVGTEVIFVPQAELASSSLTIDYEGDGVIDADILTNNSIIELSITPSPTVPSEIEEPTEISRDTGGGGTRVRAMGQVEGVTTSTDLYWQEMYRLLSELVRLLNLLSIAKV